MRSTGEVMGIDRSFPLAFLKSQLGAGTRLPLFGTVFLSLADRDKVAGAELAQGFQRLGYEICATQGTAEHLRRNGVDVDLEVAKVSEERSASEGQQTLREFEEFDGRIDAVRLISSGQVSLVINTPRGSGPRADGYRIRSAAQRHLVPALTTISAAKAALLALGELRGKELEVRSIQEFHKALQGT